MRSALLEDEADIATILQDMLRDDAVKQDILKLAGKEAEAFLTLIHRVSRCTMTAESMALPLISTLSQMTDRSFDLDGQKQRQSAYKFLIKLSVHCGILPPNLNISGVYDCEQDPITGGGFADIFRASYRGEHVALKRLREFEYQERNLIHRVLHLLSTICRSPFSLFPWQTFCKEAFLWQGLRHPHVLPFYGVDSETFAPRLSMVSPWMHHGHILKHIVDVGGPEIASTRRYVCPFLRDGCLDGSSAYSAV